MSSKNSHRSRHLTRPHRRPISQKGSLFEKLVETLGCDPVRKIIAQFGGTRIWIPVRSAPQAGLARIIGSEAAATLCGRFGGDYLQVPNTMADDSLPCRIAELHRQGRKINEIALAVGRSRRTVFRLLSTKITDLRRPAFAAARTILNNRLEAPALDVSSEYAIYRGLR